MSGNDRFTGRIIRDSRSTQAPPSPERIWADTYPLGRIFFHELGRVAFVVFWNFDINSFVPKREHLEFIRGNPQFSRFVQRAVADRRLLTCEGRASRSGDNHQNRILSHARALNIKKFLFDMPSYRESGTLSNLVQGIRAMGSSRPINYSGLSEGGQEAYNRSVTIYWGDSCRTPLSRADIETIGMRYLRARTGWRIDSIMFWAMWTPTTTLFNHIVPTIGTTLPNSQSIHPSSNNIQRLEDVLSSRFRCSENDVNSAIDSWLSTAKNAWNAKVRQEGILGSRIEAMNALGGGSTILDDVRRYEMFMSSVVQADITCTFHYNLSRL